MLNEVRDKQSRSSIENVVYNFEVRAPSAEALKAGSFFLSFHMPYNAVSEFAKKTGDYSVLSVVDLKVLALAYMLHCEILGADTLTKEPRAWVLQHRL